VTMGLLFTLALGLAMLLAALELAFLKARLLLVMLLVGELCESPSGIVATLACDAAALYWPWVIILGEGDAAWRFPRDPSTFS